MRQLSFLMVLALGLSTGSAADTSRPIWVIAHRGATSEAPENTIAAIEAAVKMGCDVVEVDVRLTKDGHAVLIHDATVDRTTNGRGRVDQLSWPQLRELNAGAHFVNAPPGTRIPLLEEAIELVRGRAMLYLDIKVTQLEPIVRVVRQADFSKSVFYRVYRPGDVDRLRQLDPSAKVIVGIDEMAMAPGVIDAVLARHPDTILSMAWDVKVKGKAPPRSSLWFLNLLGRQISASDLRQAIELRPAGIVTDSPRPLLELLR